LQVVLRDGDILVLLLDEQSRRSVIDFGFFAEDADSSRRGLVK